MAKEVTFVTGTVVSAAFLNDQQEVKSALHIGVRLEKASSTQIQLVPLDDGNDAVAGQSSMIIKGLPRWWNSTIIKTVSGAKGTYSIYVVAGESTTLEAGNITLTTGAAPANSRKIGEVDWSGAAITAIRQNGMGSVTGAMIEDGALSNAGSITWAREPSGAWVPTIAAGSVADAMLASPNNGVYRSIAEATSYLELGAAAGTYLFTHGQFWPINTEIVPAGNHTFPFPYLKLSDLEVPGKKLKLRVRATVATNATKPLQKFSAGLYQMTSAGNPNSMKIGGSLVSESLAEVNQPAASSQVPGVSPDFAVGGDGAYLLGMVLSGTLTENAMVMVTAQLQARWV